MNRFKNIKLIIFLVIFLFNITAGINIADINGHFVKIEFGPKKVYAANYYHYDRYSIFYGYGLSLINTWYGDRSVSGTSSYSFNNMTGALTGQASGGPIENIFIISYNGNAQYTTAGVNPNCLEIFHLNGVASFYTRYTDVYAVVRAWVKFNLLASNEIHNDTYPIDGVHTDGYWYVRKDLIVNAIPSINISSPSANQVYSAVAGHNSVTISGTTSDADSGDKNYIQYKINAGANTYITMATGKSGNDGNDYITANTTAKSFTSTAIDVSALSEGNHTLSVWGSDNNGGVSTTVAINIIVDKTGPTISYNPAVSTKVASTGTIQVTIASTDSASSISITHYVVLNETDAAPTKVGCTNNFVGLNTICTVTTGRKYIYNYSTDAVGNDGNIIKSPLYIVNTKPTGNITGPTDGSWYKNSGH